MHYDLSNQRYTKKYKLHISILLLYNLRALTDTIDVAARLVITMSYIKRIVYQQ